MVVVTKNGELRSSAIIFGWETPLATEGIDVTWPAEIRP